VRISLWWGTGRTKEKGKKKNETKQTTTEKSTKKPLHKTNPKQNKKNPELKKHTTTTVMKCIVIRCHHPKVQMVLRELLWLN